MGIFGNKHEGINYRAKDLEDEKYSKEGGIRGDGFYDQDDDSFGENRNLATGEKIDNSTQTGLENLRKDDADTLERRQNLISRYENAEDLSDAEKEEIKDYI